MSLIGGLIRTGMYLKTLWDMGFPTDRTITITADVFDTQRLRSMKYIGS